MARARFDDLLADGATLRRNLKLQTDGQTLGGHVTITDSSGIVNAYDCGGSSRNVTLPTRAAATDGVVRIFINLSTAGETLTIKEASTTLVVVNPGSMALAIATGTVEAPGTRAWAGYLVGGEDLAIADDLAVTGDLTVTGPTALNGVVALGNSVSDGIALYGTTTVSQRASSNQASTLGSTTASIGTAASVLLMEIANTLTAIGLWKGGA
jgi:hypothetical protein